MVANAIRGPILGIVLVVIDHVYYYQNHTESFRYTVQDKQICGDFRINQQLLYATVAMFCIFSLVLTAQKFWVCIRQTKPIDWVHTPSAFCSLGWQVSILVSTVYLYPCLELDSFLHRIADIIGDILLVLIPLRLLWSFRLSYRKSVDASFRFGGVSSQIWIWIRLEWESYDT